MRPARARGGSLGRQPMPKSARSSWNSRQAAWARLVSSVAWIHRQRLRASRDSEGAMSITAPKAITASATAAAHGVPAGPPDAVPAGPPSPGGRGAPGNFGLGLPVAEPAPEEGSTTGLTR
jgi:hypothetical protein